MPARVPKMALPKALLASYFVSAMIESLPMVAFGVFLNDEIKMPLDEQSRFYATIFLPWSFKPFFSYLMDHFPLLGSRRKAYIALANIGLGSAIVLTALFATNTIEMYLFSLARSGFEAFAECGLGLVLVDVVGSERATASDAAQLAQSRSTSARMAGSLSAFIIGLFLYGCGGWTVQNLTSRSIIGLTSLLCIFQFLFALALPEPKVETEVTPLESEPLTAEWSIRGRILVAIGVMSFQFCFVWIGFQSLVPLIPWVSVLVISSLCLLIFSIAAVVRSRVPWAPIASAALMFMMNATPGYGSPWFSFQLYALKGSSCSMQMLLILGEVASLTASWSYPKLTSWYFASSKEKSNKTRAQHALVFFTVLASLAGFLEVLLALDWQEFPAMDPFAAVLRFAVVVLFVGFLNQLSWMARQVFATEHCYDNAHLNPALTPGILYGIYLSLIDFADSASGWISAPLTAALNLSYTSQSYSLLWVMVVITIVLQLLVVLMIPPLLDYIGKWLAKRNQVHYSAVIQQDQLLSSSTSSSVAPENQLDGSEDISMTVL